MSVLVLGALHHDVVVDAPRLPRADETLTGTGVDYRFGGKGGNQAVAAARMGAEVAMVGRIGRDAAGAEMRGALALAGVDDRGVREVDAPTGMSVAISVPGGDYGAVIVSGANLLNDGRLPDGPAPNVAVIQNEVPEAANLAFAGALPDSCTLIWNAAPAKGLMAALADRTDVLVVNRVEAADLSGMDDTGIAAHMLSRRIRGEVLLTLGAEGVLHGGEAGVSHHPGMAARAVSTHGAGDMFTGALAARVAGGATVAEAIAFAQQAAAMFVASEIADRDRITAAAVAAALT